MWIWLLVAGTILVIGLWRSIGKDRMVCPLCGHGISDHQLDSTTTQPVGSYYCLRCKKACE